MRARIRLHRQLVEKHTIKDKSLDVALLDTNAHRLVWVIAKSLLTTS